MSSISFKTHLFVFVRKDNEAAQLRALYSTASDSTSKDGSRAKFLLRDGTQFSRDYPLKNELSIDSQQQKSMSISADDILISSSWDEARACQFCFAAAQAKSVSLAVNLGINSSLWMLGRCDFYSGSDHSASNSARSSILMLGGYIDHLFVSLSQPEWDGNFKREAFSVGIKCYEVFGDQIRDLMALSSVNDTSKGGKDGQQVRIREHPVNGPFVSGLVNKTFFSASKAVEATLAAYEQRLVLLSAESVDKSNMSIKQSAGPKPHRIIGTVGNVVLVLEIEQILVPVASLESNALGKGEQNVVQRSATVQFNFLCETEPICFKPSKNETISTLSLQEVNKTINEGLLAADRSAILLPGDIVLAPVQVSQLAVCAKCMAALSRVVTMIQQNTALTTSNADSIPSTESSQMTHVPYRESSLTRVLQPMLEGKYVNYIHCSLDEHAELEGAALATAAYALRLATELRAGVRSCVVLNERVSKRVASSPVPMSEDTRQQVLKAAEIAKEITSHTSQLALNEVKRAIDRSVEGKVESSLHQAELFSHYPEGEKDNRNSFWDLLQSMNADGGMNFADLEKLQQERARLLQSLEGMVRRADDTVVSRLDGFHEDVYDQERSGRGSDVGHAAMDTEGGDQKIAVSNLDASSNESYPVLNGPAALSSTFASSSTLSTPRRASPRENYLAPVRRSPHSEKLSPLSGSRPASSSAVLIGAHELPALSALSPISAELSFSSLTPRSLGDLMNPSLSVLGTESSVTARSDRIKGGESVKAVNSNGKAAAVAVSPEKMERTMRSQSVKGPRTSPVLSPVQAPLRRSHTGRALAAKTTQPVVVSVNNTVTVVGTPPRAASLLLPGTPSSNILSSKASNKRTAVDTKPPAALGAVTHLGPVHVAGRVTTNNVGLKTFVQLETADNYSVITKVADGESVNGNVVRSSAVLPMISPSDNPPVSSSVSYELKSSGPNGHIEDSARVDTYVSSDVARVAGVVINDTNVQKSDDKKNSDDFHFRKPHLSPLSPELLSINHATANPASAQSVNGFPAMADLPVADAVLAKHFSSPTSALQPNESIAVSSVLPHSASPTPIKALSTSNKIRRTLPSERTELSPAHEDAEGAHLSELEVQFLRAVSHTVLSEVAACIRMGVNIKVKNSFGRDAMQIAARNGSPKMLTLIHEHGGEISSRGPKGDTLYHLAASNGHVNVLSWLTEHVYRGAGIAGDAVDMFGQTAAHVAARRGEVAVLRYLHGELGVDVLQEDFDGRIPLEVIPKLFLSGNAEGLVEAKEFLTSVIELK